MVKADHNLTANYVFRATRPPDNPMVPRRVSTVGLQHMITALGPDAPGSILFMNVISPAAQVFVNDIVRSIERQQFIMSQRPPVRRPPPLPARPVPFPLVFKLDFSRLRAVKDIMLLGAVATVVAILIVKLQILLKLNTFMVLVLAVITAMIVAWVLIKKGCKPNVIFMRQQPKISLLALVVPIMTIFLFTSLLGL